MMRLLRLKWYAASLLLCVSAPVFSYGWPTSGKTEEISNPFIVVGFDPVAREITGYVKAIRIAPGRTDECNIVFSGNLRTPAALVLNYPSEIGNPVSAQTAALIVQHGQPILRIRKPIRQADCEWILPFVGEPRIQESPEELSLSLASMEVGDWIGVYLIKSPRARFHKTPDNLAMQASFVVKGDVVRVYKWAGNWCYVKYELRGRTTAGWLKKSDLLIQ